MEERGKGRRDRWREMRKLGVKEGEREENKIKGGKKEGKKGREPVWRVCNGGEGEKRKTLRMFSFLRNLIKTINEEKEDN